MRQLRARWDAGTFVNTYYWHPPYSPPNIVKRYDWLSFDVWGPSGRGARLDPVLGDKILAWLKSARSPGRIHWYIYKGRMMVYDYYGNVMFNGASPWGPPDSDPKHLNHIHVTYH